MMEANGGPLPINERWDLTLSDHKARLQSHQKWIQEELERSIRFWMKNGMDPVHGGVYTCLDREGKVFSTDKSVWMQGRCAWISLICATCTE